MKLFFALLIVIFLAFSGYHLTFRSLRLPLFARKFYLTGTEFLFLGLILGPQFFNLLDEDTCKGLEPLSVLLLGWIGLIFGFQFEISKLKRFLSDFFFAAICQGLLTSILVFCGVFFLFPYFIPLTGPIKLCAAFTLAAAATCTAQTGIAFFAADSIAERQHTVKLLRYISGIDGLVALIIFSAAFYFHPTLFTTFSWIKQLGHGAFISIVALTCLFVIYMLILSHRRDESELTFVVIGLTVFASGLALLVGYSSLLINFFIGFCIVNLSRDKERIYTLLISVEKPAYILLLVFLGSIWMPNSIPIIILSVVYCVLRAFGKLSGGYFITKLSDPLKRHPSTLGFGLLEQGGLPFAILYDFHKGFPYEIVDVVLSLGLLTIIYNDVLSPFFLSRLLRDSEKNNEEK